MARAGDDLGARVRELPRPARRRLRAVRHVVLAGRDEHRHASLAPPSRGPRPAGRARPRARRRRAAARTPGAASRRRARAAPAGRPGASSASRTACDGGVDVAALDGLLLGRPRRPSAARRARRRAPARRAATSARHALRRDDGHAQRDGRAERVARPAPRARSPAVHRLQHVLPRRLRPGGSGASPNPGRSTAIDPEARVRERLQIPHPAVGHAGVQQHDGRPAPQLVMRQHSGNVRRTRARRRDEAVLDGALPLVALDHGEVQPQQQRR